MGGASPRTNEVESFRGTGAEVTGRPCDGTCTDDELGRHQEEEEGEEEMVTCVSRVSCYPRILSRRKPPRGGGAAGTSYDEGAGRGSRTEEDGRSVGVAARAADGETVSEEDEEEKGCTRDKTAEPRERETTEKD